jgi:hypothetical protein
LLSFWVSLFWFVYHPDRHFHSLPNGPIFGVRLSSLKRGPGRPTNPKEMWDLAIQLATDNSTWGYTKIQGVLKSLGHRIGRTTIRELFSSSGIAPAPDRKKGKKWKDFLRENLSVISAVDFFTVEVLTLTGFQRYSVMIVMQLATRRVSLAEEYLERFHKERPHQGLDNEIIEPVFQPPIERREIVECRKRLVGLLKYYTPKERKAA